MDSLQSGGQFPDLSRGSEGRRHIRDGCILGRRSESLFLTTAKFRELVREQPGGALRLIGQLLGERAQILERLHGLASQNVEQRLVSALQRLSHDHSLLAKDGSLKLEVRHHRLLCEMVGATRESIALALGRLVESGIARRNGTALFVASTALDGHITDDMPINDAIPGSDRAMETFSIVDAGKNRSRR